jgi:hypothetical protein
MAGRKIVNESSASGLSMADQGSLEGVVVSKCDEVSPLGHRPGRNTNRTINNETTLRAINVMY